MRTLTACLAVILPVALSIGGCSQSVRFSSDLTEQVRGWTAAEVDGYRVYLLGSANNPTAVVLDRPVSGATFVSTEWSLVEGEAAHAVVTQALDLGLKVARLEDSGIVLGFLLGEDEETPSELRYFQLRVDRSGDRPSYEVLHLIFPNPQQYGDGGSRH